ncbi:MAG: hypothetical protein WBC74_02160 [Candidatus Omnitrophota bacterium]
MGKLRGQKEALKFKSGGSLTVKQAVMAMCFLCAGEEDGGNEDCQGESCPLYPYFKKWMKPRPGSRRRGEVPVPKGF